MPQRCKIGVAVAHREQPIARPQPLERRPHVGVEFDAIALGEKHFHRLPGEGFLVTGRTELRREGPAAQERQVVAALRELRRDVRPQRAHALDAVPRGRLRIASAQPLEQHLFRRGDHRPHRPQGVVQIETDDLRRAHGVILPR